MSQRQSWDHGCQTRQQRGYGRDDDRDRERLSARSKGPPESLTGADRLTRPPHEFLRVQLNIETPKARGRRKVCGRQSGHRPPPLRRTLIQELPATRARTRTREAGGPSKVCGRASGHRRLPEILTSTIQHSTPRSMETPMKPTESGTCEACGEPFTSDRNAWSLRYTKLPKKRFCSERCRRRGEYQRRKERQASKPIVVDDPHPADTSGWPIEMPQHPQPNQQGNDDDE